MYHPMRRYLLFLALALVCLPAATATAQIVVFGKIMDNTSRAPLYRATVINRRTGLGTLTDSLGNYRIEAQLNDRIVFSYLGYHPDSTIIKVAGHNAAIVNVFLRVEDYSLSEVQVNTRRNDYTRDSLERRSTYGFALDQEKTRGLSAAMHPVSGLFDALSKKQKRIWHFQKLEADFEQQAYIKSRIKTSLVEKLTDLHGDTLKLFLDNYYRPDYVWVRYVSDYDLYQNIIQAANKFKLMLPDLPDSLFIHSRREDAK
jgi:hypothetical protein